MMDSKQDQKEKAATKSKHWVRLTRVCNNNCLFCLDKDAQNGTIIPLSNIKENLLKGRKNKINQVVLSGGEATIHPNFTDIVKMARKMGYCHIQVITNGRMFAYHNFLISALKAGVNEITFSIHGHKDELHDKLTGAKGSFQQAIAGLKNALKVEGLIVNIDIVINKMNYRELRAIMDFFIALGVREFDLLQVIPSGQAWKNRKILFYNISKAIPYIRQALALSREPEVFIWTNRFPPMYLEGFEDLIQHPKKLYDEIRGRREMFDNFLEKGKLMQCHGERCPFCFLSNFCRDLADFRKSGKLFSKSQPTCLRKKKNVEKQIIFSKHKKFSIFEFLDFYIKYRYYVKSEKCSICDLNSQCDGTQINQIRKNGFKSLRPVPSSIAHSAGAYLSLSKFNCCNLKCIFCSGEFNRFKHKTLTSDDSKSLKSDLLYVRKHYNQKKLVIGGGEPLECAGVIDLVKYAERNGYEQIGLQTNGVRLADLRFAREIIKAGVNLVRMPIYGHNAEINDLITGTKGSFRGAIKAMRNLKLFPNVKVDIHTVMLKQNYLYAKDIYNLVVNDLKFVQLDFNQVLPRNMNQEDYIKVCPTYSDLKQIIKKRKMPNAIFNLPICLFDKVNADRFILEKTNLINQEEYEAVGISHEGISFRDEQKGWRSAERPTKPSKCKECKAFMFCQGAPILYLDIYGDKELSPISRRNNTRPVKK
jgi:MoaA/NifB/PqqE/SkfB family radical SAM enzyme